MISKKGYSLIELQISMVVAAILVLAIGVISEISTRSYNKHLNRAGAFNDLVYGFKLMKNRIRESNTIFIDNSDSKWDIGQLVVIGDDYDSAFGLYPNVDDGTKFDFVYLDRSDKTSEPQIILASIDPDHQCTIDCSDCSNGMVDITLKGTREGIDFNLATNMLRRVR